LPGDPVARPSQACGDGDKGSQDNHYALHILVLYFLPVVTTTGHPSNSDNLGKSKTRITVTPWLFDISCRHKMLQCHLHKLLFYIMPIPDMDIPLFTEIIRVFTYFFGVVGAAIIIFGGIGATVNIILLEARRKQITYNEIRADLTGKIVFGLDFFIAGDVLTTLLNPSMNDLFTLAAIVIIRTILGYFLSKENISLEPLVTTGQQ
jgi:uncharacterized membrane protein